MESTDKFIRIVSFIIYSIKINKLFMTNEKSIERKLDVSATVDMTLIFCHFGTTFY